MTFRRGLGSKGMEQNAVVNGGKETAKCYGKERKRIGWDIMPYHVIIYYYEMCEARRQYEDRTK